MKIPFKKLQANVEFKSGTGLHISTDDFFTQNGIRELQKFIEPSEMREIDEIMEIMTTYAKTPSKIDQKMMLPKVEFVETELIEHISNAKKREEEFRSHEVALQEARIAWHEEATPIVDKMVTLVSELQETIQELDSKCMMMRFSKGRGVTSLYDNVSAMHFIGNIDSVRTALAGFKKR